MSKANHVQRKSPRRGSSSERVGGDQSEMGGRVAYMVQRERPLVGAVERFWRHWRILDRRKNRQRLMTGKQRLGRVDFTRKTKENKCKISWKKHV